MQRTLVKTLMCCGLVTMLAAGLGMHAPTAFASTGGSNSCGGTPHSFQVNQTAHTFVVADGDFTVYAELFQYYDLKGSVYLPTNCFYLTVSSVDVPLDIDIAGYLFNDGGTYLTSVATVGPGPVTSAGTSQWTSNNYVPRSYSYMRVRLGWKLATATNYTLYPAPPGTVELEGDA